LITFTFVLRSAPLVLKYHFLFLTAGFLSEAGSVLPALESGYLFMERAGIGCLLYPFVKQGSSNVIFTADIASAFAGTI
jgi:hypothetical protein